MKRLIKLLSIFGVLIILGSCSSSKSVNVSTVTGENKYVIFTSLYSTTYPIQYLYITGGEYTNKLFFPNNSVKVELGIKYSITWTFKDTTDNNAFKNITRTNEEFNFIPSTIHVQLGNTSSLFIPEE